MYGLAIHVAACDSSTLLHALCIIMIPPQSLINLAQAALYISS